MRYESAVSDVIGAVILIGVVMGGMGILGVILLSTPPPEESPKASISSYCVRCDLNDNYEVIMYHGGGETLERKKLQFFLQTKDNSLQPLTPWWVYDSTPEDCMFNMVGESSHSTRKTWKSKDNWKSGETLRFRFTSSTEPKGFDVRYEPFTSVMSQSEFKDEIRDSTCIKEGNPGDCFDPDLELTPHLVSPTEENPIGCVPDCTGNKCKAVFNYTMKEGDLDINDNPNSTKPYNYFRSPDNLQNPGISKFQALNSGTQLITVNFSTQVEWWLDRSNTDPAKCKW